MIQVTVARPPVRSAVGPHQPKPTATTPDLTEATSTLWSASGGAEVGYWECTEGTFTARRDGYTEVCQFLAGEAVIETDGAESVTVQTGDTLVMPSGWVGRWRVTSAIRKMYVIIPDGQVAP